MIQRCEARAVHTATLSSDGEHPLHLDEDHGHVVVLVGARRRTPRSRAGSSPAARRESRWPCSSTRRPSRASPNRSLSGFIASVMPSVNKTNRSPRSSGHGVPRATRLNFSSRCRFGGPSDHAARRQHLRSVARPHAASQIDQRRVTGAGVRHRAEREIDDRVGHGDEAAASRFAEMIRFDLHQQLPRRLVDLAQRQHQAFQLGHVAGRPTSLAGQRRRSARRVGSSPRRRSRSSRRRPRGRGRTAR